MLSFDDLRKVMMMEPNANAAGLYDVVGKLMHVRLGMAAVVTKNGTQLTEFTRRLPLPSSYYPWCDAIGILEPCSESPLGILIYMETK